MRGVDLVPTVDVGSQEPRLLALRKGRYLVRRSVRPEHVVAVEVVRVLGRPARVVGREAELVEILIRRHYRGGRVDGFKSREFGLDGSTQEGEWMMRVRGEVGPDAGEDRVGYIGEVVAGIALAGEAYGLERGRMC